MAGPFASWPLKPVPASSWPSKCSSPAPASSVGTQYILQYKASQLAATSNQTLSPTSHPHRHVTHHRHHETTRLLLQAPLCGCFVIVQSQRKWLPLINLDAHATIVSSTSRTVLKQTFTNPDAKSALKEVHYDFPLYDGVSVVGFRCTVGDRVITGVVKERQAAKKTYDDAASKGETAALLQQNLRAADVFTTTLGNVPAGAKVTVEITHLGELEHDAETDGVRLTIPTSIAPRYDAGKTVGSFDSVKAGGGTISITVDCEMADGCSVTSVQSPTHPISVRIGHTSASASSAASEPASLRRASATLSLGSAHLDKDIVVQVVADGLGNPTALLETHPTLPTAGPS
ncbi:hypothetical protein ACCO45_009710 [Purpureocillium lilacinum]|uniref:Uncharacterized protein n=1 Tax=Purpureocillium lilacinum TaxID=33203 RepID=A0ACC4DMS7_PURLI